jgi:Xaa-Pro aminopeptidase
MIIGEGIEIAEFVARRERALEALDGAVGLVFAGDGPPSLSGVWEPDWNFYYLTGIRDEPGAIVLFDPGAEDPRRRTVLFLKPLNPEIEEWDGLRDRLSENLKRRTGFETVQRTYQLPRLLTMIARRRGRLACLHPFAVYDAPVSPDLAVFRKLSERSVGLRTEDRTNLLPSMRAIKSKSELVTMRRAADATAEGYRAAARAIRPGANERDVRRALEDGFVHAGGTGTGYNSIVGAGVNSCVLHYHSNNQPLADGDVVLIDAAARVAGYTVDVTRTFPVSGRFTREQREVYDLVLRAMEAAIRAVRPGRPMHEVDMAARRVIEKAGYGDAFMHGIGHQLGIEVHDSTPDGPLKAGMVVTIEPGIYLKDRRLGIRIEDDILLTRDGPRNLTAMIPKRAEEVEAMVRRGRARVKR